MIGSLMGVDIVETNVNFTRSSTVTLYSNFIAGKGAIAEVDVAGTGNASVSVVRGADAANPLNLWSTTTWKVDSYAAVVLNSTWVVDLSLIHISEPTRRTERSRMPSSA